MLFLKEDAYALNASGSIIDAFLYLKPIVALKSQLTEYYFNKISDIGCLCEGYDEVKNTVLDILNEKPFDRYVAQQKNMLVQRALFSPPMSPLSLNVRSSRRSVEGWLGSRDMVFCGIHGTAPTTLSRHGNVSECNHSRPLCTLVKKAYSNPLRNIRSSSYLNCRA